MNKYIILLISLSLFSCGIADKVKQLVSGDEKKTQKETTTKDESVTSEDIKKKELDLKDRELMLKQKELEIEKKQMENEEKLERQETEMAGTEQDMKSDDDRRSYNKSNYRSDDLGRYHGDYPEASARYLTYDDIRGKSNWQLKIMRNEIYARYGYIFQTKEMWNYFSNKSWYYPTYYDVNKMLTNVEKSNVAYIKRYE